MSWPDHILTRVVTGTYRSSSGSAAKGRITFTPTSTVLDNTNSTIISNTVSATLDDEGSFSVELPATDNPMLSPKGWAYLVNVKLYGVKPFKYHLYVPYEDGTQVNILESMNNALKTLQDETNFERPTVNVDRTISTPWPEDILSRTVTGSYKNASGDPAQGRVTFTPTATIKDDSNAIIISETIAADLDNAGSFSIELPVTDNPILYPKGWGYLVSVRLYGVKPTKFYALIPYGDGSPIDIIDVTGTTLTGLQDSTVQSAVLRGPIGPAGLDGATILFGNGAPSDSVGKDGDIYIDDLNDAFYGPKASGVWPESPFFSANQIQQPTQRYIHTQASPTSTWNITHSLGGRPSITVVDSNGTIVIGEVTYNSDTSITVSFTAPFSGYAYLT